MVERSGDWYSTTSFAPRIAGCSEPETDAASPGAAAPPQLAISAECASSGTLARTASSVP